MSIIQILVLGIALTYTARSISLFKSSLTRAGKIRTSFFLIVWLMIALFALFPVLARKISDLLTSGENLNTLIFLAITLLLVLSYKITLKIEKIDKELTKLVREQALSKIKKNE